MSAERTTIDRVAFEIIAERDDGGGAYEWGHVALVRRIDSGQLYLLDESGCSCNAPWSDTGLSDLEPVATWQEAIDKLNGAVPSHFNADDVAAFAQQLMELRPASSWQAERPAPDRG